MPLEAAIEKHRPNQRFANVGEDRDLFASPGRSFACAQTNISRKAPFARNIRARFAPHEVGQALREFAFLRGRVGIEQHFRDDEAKHSVTQKFEALIIRAAFAFGRRRMRQRLIEVRRVAEAVADRIFQLLTITRDRLRHRIA